MLCWWRVEEAVTREALLLPLATYQLCYHIVCIQDNVSGRDTSTSIMQQASRLLLQLPARASHDILGKCWSISGKPYWAMRESINALHLPNNTLCTCRCSVTKPVINSPQSMLNALYYRHGKRYYPLSWENRQIPSEWLTNTAWMPLNVAKEPWLGLVGSISQPGGCQPCCLSVVLQRNKTSTVTTVF